MTYKKKPLETRLLMRIEKTTSCWNWLGAKNDKGYGKMHDMSKAGRKDYAHRVAYRVYKGDIPEGLWIDHLCKNPSCCNPDHLEAVTPRENSMRGNCPAFITVKTQRCKHGHDLTPENTRVINSKRDGLTKRCRICVIKESRERNQRRRLGIPAGRKLNPATR